MVQFLAWIIFTPAAGCAPEAAMDQPGVTEAWREPAQFSGFATGCGFFPLIAVAGDPLPPGATTTWAWRLDDGREAGGLFPISGKSRVGGLAWPRSVRIVFGYSTRRAKECPSRVTGNGILEATAGQPCSERQLVQSTVP